jgi:small subunit ribosomal protein S13
MFGLRVRGQCTRTTGRRGGAVGVKKTGKPMPAGGVAGPSTPSAPGVGATAAAAAAPTAESAPPKPTTSASKEPAKK